MHDKDTNSILVGITNAATTNIATSTIVCTQIVVNCSSSNSLVLSLKDRTPGRTWVGPLALSVMNAGPLILRFDSPLRFQDGVVAVSTGNGSAAVAVSKFNTDGL